MIHVVDWIGLDWIGLKGMVLRCVIPGTGAKQWPVDWSGMSQTPLRTLFINN